jgi:hypothetical protein
MAYKVKPVLSVYVLVVFKILFVFIAKKSKCQFLLASLKILDFLNPSSSHLQRACCGIRKPACYCETCSGTRL